MNFALPQPDARYKSERQRARVATEPWVAENLYCAACASRRLESHVPNTPARDFLCPACSEHYELKSTKSPFGKRISDGDYAKMFERLSSGEAPNFLTLRYDRPSWRVETVLLIPRFVISISAIKKCNPSHVAGRKRPWTGCVILLEFIPPAARIPVVLNGAACPSKAVREAYQKFRPLQEATAESRGWQLDVLFVIRSLGKRDFTVEDVHSAKDLFAQLHPANRFIRAKIRQQLQDLCRWRLIARTSPGHYRLL